MEDFDRWVAEFLFRRQLNPRATPTNLLAALKLRESDSPDCLKLKISSVLQDISDFLIQGTLDEGMLDILEILEELLLQQDSILMESHKSAYCWTAVECTLNFMWPLRASDGLFTHALKRIWTKRVGILKKSGSKLVTPDLLKWETDLMKALEDPEVYHRIRETNIRYTSISFLNQLLKEQWELLGCSSLESVAQRKRKAVNVEGDVVDNRGDPNAVDESKTRLKRDTIDNANERCGNGEGEEENGNNRKNADTVKEVGCLENNLIDKVNVADEENNLIDKVNVADEENKMGAEEHEPSLNKGDETAAQELKASLLAIQRQIDPSTSQGKETNNAVDHSVDVTPQPSQVNKTKKVHNEALDNVNEKGSSSQGKWSGRVRPRLPSPVSLNVSPMKKGSLAKPPVRKPKKFWTPEEVEALREGVKEFGKSWKDIKNANPAVFMERTEVDLKDKWRNLGRR